MLSVTGQRESQQCGVRDQWATLGKPHLWKPPVPLKAELWGYWVVKNQ